MRGREEWADVASVWRWAKVVMRGGGGLHVLLCPWNPSPHAKHSVYDPLTGRVARESLDTNAATNHLEEVDFAAPRQVVDRA